MPLKTNVGVSRKVANNNYGSRGASVNLEVELDSGLVQQPDKFLERVRQVFRLAQQAVDEELSRQTTGSASENGHATTNGHTNSNGHPNGQVATDKQLDYARQLAKQINGLGVRRLEGLAAKMFRKPLVALTTLDASGLIDTLKAIKSGKVNLDAALEASAA